MSCEDDADEVVEVDLDAWPNCSVPDCEFKSWRAGASPLCYAHAHGCSPGESFEAYMERGPTR